MDWPQADFIFGNPPFIGKKEQNAEQKADMQTIFGKAKGINVLDYVSCWYKKASDYMDFKPHVTSAFVSTNSITQGEQVPVLWKIMAEAGNHIRFAHRTFQWTSAAKGKAAVHCVIIGFGKTKAAAAQIFSYARPEDSEPQKNRRITNQRLSHRCTRRYLRQPQRTTFARTSHVLRQHAH